MLKRIWPNFTQNRFPFCNDLWIPNTPLKTMARFFLNLFTLIRCYTFLPWKIFQDSEILLKSTFSEKLELF